MGYWYEGYDGDNGNTGGSSGGGGGNSDRGGATTNPLTDGVDISNSKNFTFNTEEHTVFHEQLTKLLESNSVLKSILGYFNNGCTHLTFYIDNLAEDMTALTTYVNYESYHMYFNLGYITDEGWNGPLNVIDNIGYDFRNLRTPEEALLVTLTHESIHAKHLAVFNDAFIQGNGIPEQISSFLRNSGYSQEFINIFIDQETNTLIPNDKKVENMHAYMKKYDHEVITKALEEYRNEFK